jgi:spore coat-associated protein N
MRRILFPLLVIGLAGGLFTLGSGAFFTDTETDTGNTITTGTLDLTLGSTVGACDYTNVAPGDQLAACDKTLNMGGSLDDLYLAVELHSSSAACNSGGANDSSEYCDTNANLVAGNLLVHACSFASGVCPWAFTPDTTTLADLISEGCVALDTDSDHTEDNRVLSLTFKVAANLPNAAQGDAISVDYHFGLTQASDAPASRCHP